MREILCFKDSQIPSHLKLDWKDLTKGALYRQIVCCVCCTLTLNYPISIDLSFNHPSGGDNNFIPQNESPTALTTTLTIGSKWWLLRYKISHLVQHDLGTLHRTSIHSPSTVVLWRPHWTGTKVSHPHCLYITTHAQAPSL